MSDQILSVIVYTVVAIVAGAGEYFKLVPTGTMAVVLGGILGHNISLASTTNALKQTTPDSTPSPVAPAKVEPPTNLSV